MNFCIFLFFARKARVDTNFGNSCNEGHPRRQRTSKKTEYVKRYSHATTSRERGERGETHQIERTIEQRK